MKNKFLKAFLLSCALTLSFGVATGCGNTSAMVEEADEKEKDKDEEDEDKDKDEEKKEKKKKREKESEEETTVEEETESEKETEEETEVEEESTEEADTEEVTEEVEEEDDNNTTALSGDWTSMEFTLDGKNFKIPFSYKELEAEGWSFDMADYGYEDGYVLNPGEKVYATIDLENPEYEDVTMYVGFKNIGEEVMDITECAVWSIEVDTCYGWEQLEKYPEMTLANGLTFGDTKSDVEAVCGSCEDIYESEDYGYVVYEYDVDDYVLEMTIFDDLGITSFDLSTYE